MTTFATPRTLPVCTKPSAPLRAFYLWLMVCLRRRIRANRRGWASTQAAFAGMGAGDELESNVMYLGSVGKNQFVGQGGALRLGGIVPCGLASGWPL